MKHAIFNDLRDGNFFFDADIQIGGTGPCIKVFDSEGEAISYAADLIRHNCPDIVDEARKDGLLGDEDILVRFQKGLHGHEYFHIFPIADF